MPKQPRSLLDEVMQAQTTDASGITVTVDRRGRRRAGRLVPDSFTATATGGPLPGVVTLEVALRGERLECVGLRITTDDPPYVTSVGLRSVPVDRLVRMAQQGVAGHVAPSGSGVRFRPATASERAKLDTGHRDARSHRRRPVDVQTLTEVAAAWRSVRGLPGALAQGAAQVHRSRSQFHRLLEKAVEKGFLDANEVPRRGQPPTPTPAGERVERAAAVLAARPDIPAAELERELGLTREQTKALLAQLREVGLLPAKSTSRRTSRRTRKD